MVEKVYKENLVHHYALSLPSEADQTSNVMYNKNLDGPILFQIYSVPSTFQKEQNECWSFLKEIC